MDLIQKKIKRHLQTSSAQSLKSKRQGKFGEAKLFILQLLEQLEKEPENSFERNVMCEDDAAFILSADNLDRVETYLNRLAAEAEENKWEQIIPKEKLGPAYSNKVLTSLIQAPSQLHAREDD